MNRSARIVPVPELTRAERARMLGLMREQFLGVDEAAFAADLAGKRWAILLEADGLLYGFSTQTLLEVDCDGARHRLMFSGDTVVARGMWGGLELPLAWGCLMRGLRAREARPLHWLLISKGYKTYRFLPVFFRAFTPSRRGGDAAAAGLLAAAAAATFGERWDPAAGIVRARPGDQRLRPGIADPAERDEDPDVAFFLERNPGHADGDELACLARFDEDNLVPFIRRHLDRARVTLPPL